MIPMSDDIAIRVRGLGKKYLIGGPQVKYHTFRDAIVNSVKAPVRRLTRQGTDKSTNEFWALKDVSFDVYQGEVIGIIGRNGAGKSTLLKILSQITTPTEGEVDIFGRVGSLLEVGTGFHPELTGRENIFLSGSILGMQKREIEGKFDGIIKFSEIEKFIDTPVKRYSSGMYVRLAFAVAAYLDPEILLVDEVLAVGDIGFQEKCLGKMESIADSGRTVLFVSHNMAAISNLCSKCILLDKGKILAYGSSEEVINLYLNSMKKESEIILPEYSQRKGNGLVRFTGIKFFNSEGNDVNNAISGKDFIISLEYVSKENKPLNNVMVWITFYGLHRQLLFTLNNELVGEKFVNLPPKGRIICSIPQFPLSSGVYGFNFDIAVNGQIEDWIIDKAILTVSDGDFFGTGRLPPDSHKGFLVHHNWKSEGI